MATPATGATPTAEMMVNVFDGTRQPISPAKQLLYRIIDGIRSQLQLSFPRMLEVLANKISGGLTDPRAVYSLRWIAGRHAGIPEFNPAYTIDEAP